MNFFTKHETVCLFVLLLFCAHTLKYLFLECLRYFWTSARDEIFCFALLKPVSTVRWIDVRKDILPQARLAGWTANLRLGNWNVWWWESNRQIKKMNPCAPFNVHGTSRGFIEMSKVDFYFDFGLHKLPQTNKESERSLSSDARNHQQKKTHFWITNQSSSSLSKRSFSKNCFFTQTIN